MQLRQCFILTMEDVYKRQGKLYVDQGIIAGCAGGGFENICDAADILNGHSIGADEFTPVSYTHLKDPMELYSSLILGFGTACTG